MASIRANAHYRFEPSHILDITAPAHKGLRPGDIVRVVNLPGCPRAGTMGQCHVTRDGQFMGMVACCSLYPLPSRARQSAAASARESATC